MANGWLRPLLWTLGIAAVLTVGLVTFLVARIGFQMLRSEPPLSARAPARDQSRLPKLPDDLQGTVLFVESDLISIDLPTLAETKAWKRSGRPNLHSIAGPDKKGRVAMIVNDMMGGQHALTVRDLKSGSEFKLFDRKGDALWGDIPTGMEYVSETLALSPDSGQLALGVDMPSFQIHNPDALVHQGPLEIWDLATKKSRRLALNIADCGFSWFPDGQHLAVVELVSPSAAQPVSTKGDKFMESFRSANVIPVISILDTATGKRIQMHQGWQPIVSDDGKTILASDYEFHLRLIDVATMSSRPVSLPGFYGAAIAVIGSEAAIYLAEQPTGEERLTEHNSPLVGPKNMPRIAYAKFNASAAQPVVGYVDPRWQVSFGQGRTQK